VRHIKICRLIKGAIFELEILESQFSMFRSFSDRQWKNDQKLKKASESLQNNDDSEKQVIEKNR